MNANQREGDGVVTQVILDPRSRLLSHVAVRIRKQQTERHENTHLSKEYVIPVSAIEAANRDNIWLKVGEEIRKYPVFRPGQYPLAAQDWKPPFPYQAGTVRLSR